MSSVKSIFIGGREERTSDTHETFMTRVQRQETVKMRLAYKSNDGSEKLASRGRAKECPSGNVKNSAAKKNLSRVLQNTKSTFTGGQKGSQKSR